MPYRRYSRARVTPCYATLGRRMPLGESQGFLVQPMIRRPRALELIIGLVDDPLFGPVVMFGQGGTAVELMQDTTLELPPLNDALARAQMAGAVFRQCLKCQHSSMSARP